MKKPLFIAAAALIIVAGLWSIVIPENLIADVMENCIGRDYLYLKTEGLKKGLFYNFSADRITLMRKNQTGMADYPLLAFTNVKGNFEFLSLLTMSPALSFEGQINDGEVKGFVRLTGEETLMITGEGIQVHGMPLFEPFGIYGNGFLSGSFVVSNNKADLKFTVRDVQLASTSIGGVFLPLDLFHEIRGSASVKNGLVELQSFAMSGTGIYARVKGSIRGADMNMSVELMTDSSFTTEPLFQFILDRYKVSPGYAVIPLKGAIPRTEGG